MCELIALLLLDKLKGGLLAAPTDYVEFHMTKVQCNDITHESIQLDQNTFHSKLSSWIKAVSLSQRTSQHHRLFLTGMGRVSAYWTLI